MSACTCGGSCGSCSAGAAPAERRSWIPSEEVEEIHPSVVRRSAGWIASEDLPEHLNGSVLSIPGEAWKNRREGSRWTSVAEVDDLPPVRRPGTKWEGAEEKNNCGAPRISPARMPWIGGGTKQTVAIDAPSGDTGEEPPPEGVDDVPSTGWQELPPEEFGEFEEGEVEPYCMEYVSYSIFSYLPSKKLPHPPAFPKLNSFRPPDILESQSAQNYAARPACRPADRYPSTTFRRFYVCWGTHPTFEAAVAELESRGEAGEKQLWESITESGFLDVRGLERKDFGSMLKEYGSREDWDEYGVDRSKSLKSPRREVMQTALWLIATMEKGIPETYDRFDNVREEIAERIQRGDMEYHIFNPRQFPLDTVKNILCRKVTTPMGLTTPGVVPGDCGPLTRCVSRMVLMMSGTLSFEFSGITGESRFGSHHAKDKDIGKVYLCSVTVDRAGLGNKALTDDLEPATRSSMEFGIDYPLVMGGQVTVCVITNRSPDCADQPATECWQSSPPEGLENCLNRIGGIISPESERHYER